MEIIAGGKLPPHALELEQAVLGAMLIDKNSFNIIVEILKVESFYDPKHQHIFQAAIDLYDKGDPIDLIRINSQLRTNETLDSAGGAYYITSLTNRVTSSVNVEYHARIVAEKHIQREMIRVGNEMLEKAYEESTDALELMDDVQRKIFEVSEKNIKNKTQSISDVIKKAIDRLEKMKTDDTGLSGIGTGLKELDKMTSGFQNSNLIIVAARPGMGKTALALTIARNAAVQFGKSVAFFSLEMSGIELVTRLMSLESEINSYKFKSNNLDERDWERLNEKINNLSNANLFIDETPGLSVFELKAKCRRLKAQSHVDMVMVDYLQLMKGDRDNNTKIREQEISYISRSLKELAKELDIPVIALAQLSRQVEQQAMNKRPMLSHLRESGSIEQDADQVMFIYRPEKYKIDFFDDEQTISSKGRAEIILEKNRHGNTGSVIVKFMDEFTKFADDDGYLGAYGGDGAGVTENYNPMGGFGGGGGNDTITFQSRMNDEGDDF